VCLRPFVYPRTAEEPQKLFTFPLHSTAQARQAHASCRISCSCSGVDRSPPRKQMGRAPCCGKVGLKKGRWTREEDEILARYIEEHGEGSWRSLPKNAGTWIERPIDSEEMKREMVEKLHEHQASSLFANELRRLICGQSLSLPLFHSLSAGLLRCGKSCRLRWINYLRAGLKRGNITEEEEDVIVKLHATLGNRYPPISIYLSVCLAFDSRSALSLDFRSLGCVQTPSFSLTPSISTEFRVRSCTVVDSVVCVRCRGDELAKT
jgi:hypothetical protein